MNPIKLICFDLDLTLINHTSWRELGAALGVSPEDDAKLLQEYKEGKLTYQDWNNKIVELYKKHDAATRIGITEILSRHTYTEGAQEIVAYLKSKGFIVVLISGSMDILVEMVAKDLGISYAKSINSFIFDSNDRIESIIGLGDDTPQKLIELETFCTMLNLSIDECACIGDGDNDIALFKKTGHGITFRGSPIEAEAWKVIDALSDLKTIFP